MTRIDALRRFFAPAMSDGEELLELPAEEAHHLVRVLRLRAGDEIAVFDGRGRERRARVESAARGRASVRLLESIVPAAEPRVALTLAQAALKGDKMDAVVRDATMLGAATIQPLITRRSLGNPEAVRGERAHERWRRVAIASAKQCRRAVVPDILPGADFETWLRIRPETGYILVEPSASVDAIALAAVGGRPTPHAATLLVGPEGGWDAREIEAARTAGYTALTLGDRTLRADAAPVVAIAALGAIWRDL